MFLRQDSLRNLHNCRSQKEGLFVLFFGYTALPPPPMNLWLWVNIVILWIIRFSSHSFAWLKRDYIEGMNARYVYNSTTDTNKTPTQKPQIRTLGGLLLKSDRRLGECKGIGYDHGRF